MKKIILAALSLLLGLVSFTQGSSTEKKSITENGITKSWTVTKEYDEQGNVVDYDSTYSESKEPRRLQENQDIMGRAEHQMPKMDSLMTKMKADMAEMISEVNKMIEDMKIDSMFNGTTFSPDTDAPSQEKFNFPENENGNKPKGTRT